MLKLGMAVDVAQFDSQIAQGLLLPLVPFPAYQNMTSVFKTSDRNRCDEILRNICTNMSYIVHVVLL